MASNGPGQGIDKKRTITIDPSMYSISKKTKRNAQTSNKNAAKIKPRPFIRPNSLKRELIAKIKLHQQQKQQKQEQQPHQEKQEHQQHQQHQEENRDQRDQNESGLANTAAFSNSFNDSLSYLQSLTNNRQTAKRRDKKKNARLQQPPQTPQTPQIPQTIASSSPEVHIDMPESFNSTNTNNVPTNVPTVEDQLEPQPIFQLNNEPAWGCLKNGGKPTFRMVNNVTIKNSPSSSVVPTDAVESEISASDIETRNATNEAIENMYGSRKQRLEEYKRDHAQNTIKKQQPIIKIRETKQHVITKKYKLGKYVNKNGPVIGVLIKNRQTQYNIEKKRNEMKHIPLHTIKARLHKKNLLKVGSIAPPDVLRELYETAVFAGDIEYENEGTLLHNFLTSSESSSSPENDSGSS
jgi:hypothetical protein